jgi:hypothetical protein
MADENPTGTGEATCRTNYEEDRREQAAVLRHVLDLHPALTLTRPELIRELTAGRSPSFSDSDAIERALRDLIATGLLHPLGEDGMVRPTRAALRCWELIEEAG